MNTRHFKLSLRAQFLSSFSAIGLLTTVPTRADTIYWDGTGTTWAIAGWSTSPTATTPDPAAVPGVNDTIYFSISSVATAQSLGLNGNRSVAGMVFNNSGAVNMTAHASSNTNANMTLGTGGITINSGAGAVTVFSNATRGFLTWRLAGNQSWTNDSANLLTIAGGITNNSNSTPTTLTLSGAGSGGITQTGVISDNATGTTSVVVNSAGSGAITLSSANTYTGGTTLTAGTLVLTGASSAMVGGVTVSGGTLRVGNDAAIGTGTLTVNGGTLDTNDGTARTLSTNNAQTWAGDFAFTGTGNLNLGTGAVTMSGATRTLTANAGILTVGGAIGDGGNGYGLTKSGAGILVLSGAHTYTGATTVSQGTLRGSIGAGALSVASGATYELNSADRSIAALSGAGNVTLGSNTLTTSSSSNSTFSGVISGSGGLTKTGSGTLTLAGANDFSGPTAVNAGGLIVTGSLAGSLNIGASGSLSGTNTFSNNVTISGTHNPGNSPGIQTFANLTYNNGANVNWELSANTITQGAGTLGDPYTFDQIVVTGTLDFAGATSLNLAFNGAGSTVNWTDPFWAANRTWLVYDSTTTNNYSSLTLSALNWTDGFGNQFNTALAGASFGLSAVGSDVYLNYSAAAIPEPSTYAALAGLGALGLALWRRRHRSQLPSSTAK